MLKMTESDYSKISAGYDGLYLTWLSIYGRVDGRSDGSGLLQTLHGE